MKRILSNHIKWMFAVLCLGMLAASCSDEMENGTATATDVAQQIKIGDFPAFGEGAQSRTIGTEDHGKTAWAEGDQVLLKLQLKKGTETSGTPYCYVLTYNETTQAWTADKPIDIYRPDYNITLADFTADITAYYAPAYKWDETNPGNVTLIDGKTTGTDEFLTYTASNATICNGITINFSQASARDYSRLRVAVAEGMEATLTCSSFIPAGTLAALGASETLTSKADAKGNAYFFGSWEANAEIAVTIKDEGVTFAEGVAQVTKTPVAASEAGKSYALNGLENLTEYTHALDAAESTCFIHTAAQLKHFGEDYSNSVQKNVKLRNDIDMQGVAWKPAHLDISNTFDGDNHTIANFKYEGQMPVYSNALNSIGKSICGCSFFGRIFNGGTVKNLIFMNPTVAPSDVSNEPSYYNEIATVSYLNEGTIQNVHVINGTVTSLFKTSSMSYNSYVAGLVAESVSSIIGCSVANTLIKTPNAESNVYAGGLIGNIGFSGSTATLYGCFFHGMVDKKTSTFGSNYSGLVTSTCSIGYSSLEAVYCQESDATATNDYATKAFGFGSTSGTSVVNGTGVTWESAVSAMNTAISKYGLTDYEYVYDATLGYPKMVKK